MKLATFALAAAFMLSGTMAYAQTGSSGTAKAGEPAATKTTTGDSLDRGTTVGMAKGKHHKKHAKHHKMHKNM
jgi:hypothetical protein